MKNQERNIQTKLELMALADNLSTFKQHLKALASIAQGN